MSVLIKGISSLNEGLYQIQDGKIHAYKGNGGKTEGYDLIEVPTPHGRLIDADALPHYTGYALSASEVAKAVETAPTIIDAEEGEDK